MTLEARRTYYRDRMRELRVIWRTSGRCITCGSPALPLRSECDTHRQRTTARNRAKQQNAVSQAAA